METRAAKTLSLWFAVLIIAALGVFFLRGSFSGEVAFPALGNARAEVLRLAERGRALGDTDKKRLFELLSGEQFREYQFNARERALILKAIGG